jgi:hypothetical protein
MQLVFWWIEEEPHEEFASAAGPIGALCDAVGDLGLDPSPLWEMSPFVAAGAGDMRWQGYGLDRCLMEDRKASGVSATTWPSRLYAPRFRSLCRRSPGRGGQRSVLSSRLVCPDCAHEFLRRFDASSTVQAAAELRRRTPWRHLVEELRTRQRLEEIWLTPLRWAYRASSSDNREKLFELRDEIRFAADRSDAGRLTSASLENAFRGGPADGRRKRRSA